MRESSPPEATLASGRGVLPAWPATRNSPTRGRTIAAASGGSSATSNRPPAMPSCCIARVTAAASFGAPRGALADTCRAVAVVGGARGVGARRSASRSAAASSARSSPSTARAAPAARPAGGDSAAPGRPTPTSARRDRAQPLRVELVCVEVAPACAPRPAIAPARRRSTRSFARGGRRRRDAFSASMARAASDSAFAPFAVGPRSRRARRGGVDQRLPIAPAGVCSASSSSHSSAPGASLSTRRSARPAARARARARRLLLASLERRARRGLRAIRPSARPAAPRRSAHRRRAAARTAGARVRLCQACWPWMSTSASAGLAQLRGRGGAAVDPGAALALRVDRAPQQQPAGVLGSASKPASARARPPARRRVELGRDLGARRAFAHHAGVAATAERELQRVDQDRLARAGLAVSTEKPDPNSISSASTMTKSRRRCSMVSVGAGRSQAERPLGGQRTQ
jgi:hypothetical protein